MCKYCEHAEEFWDTDVNCTQFLFRFPDWEDEDSEEGFNHLFKTVKINPDNGEVYEQWHEWADGMEWYVSKCPHCERTLT